MADGQVEHRTWGHGVYYVTRDGQMILRLDGGPGDPCPILDRPEREIAAVLLRYAAETQEGADRG